MSLKISTIIVFATLSSVISLVVQPEWKIYYDIKTNKTIDAIDTSNPRLQLYRQRMLKIGFGPIPCDCEGFTCGCCSGFKIEAADLDRRACMNFTYVPQEFGINMNMLMNEEIVFNRTFSAKNPPPICMPAPIPPVLPRVDFCMKFFNIHTDQYNIFTCVDFETRIERAPILVLHFDCMRLGQDGISHHKPDETFEVADIEGQGDGDKDEEVEIYDEVVEDGTNKNVTESNMADGVEITIIIDKNRQVHQVLNKTTDKATST